MATLLESVNALKDTIEGFATSLATVITNAVAATDSANAAAASANAAGVYNPLHFRLIFIDAVNGDDANDGSAVGIPVKTWARMGALMEGSSRARVHLLSDIVADQVVNFFTPPSSILFFGSDTAGAATQRKITFIDDPDTATYPGGLYIYSSMSINTLYVDFEMAYTGSRSPIFTNGGHLVITANQGTITRTGTGTGALFRPSASAHFTVTAITIDASASGYVVYNVASAGDPNTVNGYSANFTSA